MQATHEPHSEFVERLEGQIVREVRRRNLEITAGPGWMRLMRPWPALAVAAVLVLAAVSTAILWRPADDAMYRIVEGDVSVDDPPSLLRSFGGTGTIRSNGGGGAVLELADTSRIEMRSHTELSLDRTDDGLRIRLNAGGIIVNAAKQRTGHLYVQTKDMTVSVVGTVFVVNADDDGSSVTVIEGEVRVRQGATEQRLRPGEQVATNPAMASPPVREVIAWSRNAERLAARLQQLSVALPVVGTQREPAGSFEVISIRTRRGAGEGGGRGAPAAGSGEGPCTRGSLQIDPRRIAVANAGLYTLITLAYGLGSDPVLAVNCRSAAQLGRLVGGPEWIHSDTFDVEALIPEAARDAVGRGDANGYEISAPLQRRLQALLADRFKLVIRPETRDTPAYLLTVASGGPKLARWTEGDSINIFSGFGAYEAMRNYPPFKHDYGDVIVGHLGGSKVSTTAIASRLERIVRRPVVDRTGISGEFRFEIFFAPAGFYTPRESDRGRPFLARPSLFSALEDELGLRLDPSTQRVESLIVERVERPTDN